MYKKHYDCVVLIYYSTVISPQGEHKVFDGCIAEILIFDSMGKQWKHWLTLFLEAPKSLQMVIAVMKLKDTYSLEGKL